MASPPTHLMAAAFREGSKLALSHLEQELVWLTQKVRRDKELIEKAKDFFDEKQYNWSRGVLNLFLMTLDKMEDQLFYEEHRLEMLAWQIVEAREGRSGDIYSLPKT
jgi:hypothetical protein